MINNKNKLNSKTYKCGYNQCKFGGEVSQDIAVKNGVRYYHPECLRDSQNKNEIRKLFFEHINRTEIASVLNKTINNIIDVKNVPSEFLLYALKYVIKNKIPLNHAGGLYYIINNDKIKTSYQKLKAKEILVQMKDSILETNNEITFNINIENNSWDKIIQR